MSSPGNIAAIDDETFRALTDPHRRELHVHCYRLLGSVQDAEDLVQETLLAAWRGIDGFEGRSSLRAWLYTIATNRCLNALRAKASRPPTGLQQPYPDALIDGLADESDGPDAQYETKEAVGLAFVTGLQRMAPQQRAVLVLRDVLGYRAAETALMLGTTEASVTSALQRARAQLYASPERPVSGRLPDGPEERKLVARFGEAFEQGDVDAIVATLTEDAWLRMPPEPLEYQGRDAIAAFLRTRTMWDRGRHLIPTEANGAPAFAYYVPDATAQVLHAGGLVIVMPGDGGVAELTRFGDTGVLPWFGLPRTLPA